MIHLYCGDGKGKTTAAVGLALRMAGHGEKVLFCQFMKGGPSGEFAALEQNDRITVLRLSKEYDFYMNLSAEEKNQLKKEHTYIIEETLRLIDEKDVKMVILDEITYPYNWDLLEKEKVEFLLYNKCKDIEIICTGREPAKLFVDLADYMTEMKCRKHPYENGVEARKGVEW